MIDEIKGEEEVEIKLGLWLMENGCEVFFNRNSKNIKKIIPNMETFKVEGTQKRPDMIFKFNKEEVYVVLEIKDAEHTINLRQGAKILDYYNQYIKKISKYKIKGGYISPSHFLVATQHSINGHLFKIEETHRNNIEQENLKKLVEWRLLPPYEYEKTYEYIRQLWQNWKKEGRDESCGVGVLISDVLNKPLTRISKGKPALFTQQKNNKRWIQKYIPLREGGVLW